jgi:hypothetical protein
VPPVFTALASVSYNARLVDAVGNPGPAATTKSFTIDYFACDQVRALAGSSTSNHNPIANGRCDTCHSIGSSSTSTPTPSGTFVAPQITATGYYWCRKP